MILFLHEDLANLFRHGKFSECFTLPNAITVIADRLVFIFEIEAEHLLRIFVPLGARADDAALAPREVPAKSIPVPTDVSPGMQRFIAAPLNPVWHDLWKTGEEWRKAADKMDAAIVPTIPAMAERLHVKIVPSTMDGVKVFIVTPDEIPPENRNRLLIHIHGGCYVLFPGEAGATEAITMAGLEHFKVISVDYRMPPEAYFPAAIDDVLTVYKAAQRRTVPDPKNMAIFGTSAGGALTLAVILRAKEQGVALPGAISAGTPMSDATKTGDSFYTNELVDNVLVSRDGFCDAATVVYANGHDLQDPLISPVYGGRARIPASHPDHRHTRPAAEQHGAGASRAPRGWGGGTARGLRSGDRGCQRRRCQAELDWLRLPGRRGGVTIARSFGLSPVGLANFVAKIHQDRSAAMARPTTSSERPLL